MLKKIRKCKITFSGVLSVLLVLSSAMVAFAQNFNKVYVYGERYTVVADGPLDNTADFLTVTVTQFYLADGTETTSYKTVLGDVLNDSGDQISKKIGVPLVIDTATNVEFFDQYDARTPIKLRMKGNIPSLDCMVDFVADMGVD